MKGLSEYDEYISELSDKKKKAEKAMLKGKEMRLLLRQKQAENLCRDIRDALADLEFHGVFGSTWYLTGFRVYGKWNR